MRSAKSCPDWIRKHQDGRTSRGQKSGSQARHRCLQTKNLKLVKGPWTEEEDRKVKKLVHKYGLKNWSIIAKHMRSRNGKQCRDRWMNHLKPSLKKGSWSPEEDNVVFQAQRQLGNRWAAISKLLPGRSDNAIKNRWNATLRKQVEKKSKMQMDPQGLSSSFISSVNQAAPRSFRPLHRGRVHREETRLPVNIRTPPELREQIRAMLESGPHTPTPLKIRHQVEGVRTELSPGFSSKMMSPILDGYIDGVGPLCPSTLSKVQKEEAMLPSASFGAGSPGWSILIQQQVPVESPSTSDFHPDLGGGNCLLFDGQVDEWQQLLNAPDLPDYCLSSLEPVEAGDEWHPILFGGTDDQRSQTEQAQEFLEAPSAQPTTSVFLFNSL